MTNMANSYKLVGVIPAAGEGVRLHPQTKTLPKSMLNIDGKSILQRNIELMRDELKIKKIFIIIGFLGDQIQEKFGDGSKLGVRIEYIKIKDSEIKQGIGNSLLLIEKFVRENFVVILGDELYLNSNHKKLLSQIRENEFNAICGVKKTFDYNAIKKNYSVELKGKNVSELIEKPNEIINDLLGCGTYIFNPMIFDYIKKEKEKNKKVEITNLIDSLAKEKGKVLPFFLEGEYVNINSSQDLNYATYLIRNKNFDNYKLSVVIPAYNEELSIAFVVDEFKKYVDEVVVADGGSEDRTVEIAKKAGVKVIMSKKSGYGCAIREGIDAAKGDIIILTEADGSFKAKDLPKLLEYLKEADMVIGTRTTKQLIEYGANMGTFLRVGNIFLAKFLEVLWWNHAPRFTDVGCTYRAVWKNSYLKVKDFLYETGPSFSPEMMVEFVRAKMRVIELPVNYYNRIGGESKHSGSKIKSIKTGLSMLKMILKKRLWNGNL